MKKIFVTGASGFIGCHLLQKLLENVDDGAPAAIYCLLRDPEKLPEGLRSRIMPLQGDHTNLRLYASIIRECELIYHVGARSSLGDGTAYQSDNVDFTNELIEIAGTASNLKRFVFTSSIGAVDRSPEDVCRLPLDEYAHPYPLSDYGRSKLISEEALERSSLPYTIVRPTWVYGPGMRKDSHIRVFIDAVVKGKLFTKFSFPGRVSLIHVSDLVDAMILVAQHPASLRQTYFATDNVPVSLGELFKIIGRMTGVNSGRITVGCGIPSLLRRARKHLPLTVQNLFNDVLCASGDKLTSLGFTPSRDQHRGIYDTAHWHFQEEDRQQGRTKCALVTGGASGIGKAACYLLYARGYDIIIADRDIKKTQEAAAHLNALIYTVDLSADAEIDKFALYLEEHAETIDVLINNAGIGKRGLFAESDPVSVQAIMRINCIAPMLSTRAVLKPFLDPARTRTIINIASSAAYQPLPYMAVYAASKACLLSFSEAITGESSGSQGDRVEIITVSPSGTATNFQATAGVKNDDSDRLLSAEDTAGAIISAIGKGSRTLIIGTSGKGMALAARFLPKKVQILLWEKLMRSLR